MRIIFEGEEVAGLRWNWYGSMWCGVWSGDDHGDGRVVLFVIVRSGDGSSVDAVGIMGEYRTDEYVELDCDFL